MHEELTNLLPEVSRRAFRRTYFLRLAVLSLVALSGVAILHALFLLPTYLYAERSVHAEEKSLAALDATLSTSEERMVNTRLAALRTHITKLGTLSQSPTASAPIRAVLGLSRPGITLTGFTVTPATSGAPAKMSVSGTARSRDSLRQYVVAIGSLSFVSSADLPISTYAKETNIPFTIMLSGSLTP